ncbi:hypothetical protein PPH41_42635 [Burkholderia gladioli]|nr:hypothetical protein [Burkholderia gladioli]
MATPLDTPDSPAAAHVGEAAPAEAATVCAAEPPAKPADKAASRARISASRAS